jgi:DeoR/GlpR family transcriptional regulator of sugar metabolism
MHKAAQTGERAMMLPEERRRQIVGTVEREGRVLASEIAALFATSEDTIRRDLRDLDAAGLLRRVHGGAIRRNAAEPSFRHRERISAGRKARLAQAAAGLIREGDAILIDAGSTNLVIARTLADGLASCIITNSPPIAAALGEFRRTEVVMLGGSVVPETGAVGGAGTLRDLAGLHADLCFIGACSVEPGRGLGATLAGEAVIKRAMIEASGRTAATVLNERLLSAAPFCFASLGALSHLIVEADAPKDALRRIAGTKDAPEILTAKRAAQ